MRNRFVLAADLAVIALSVLGAFVLRLDWFFGRQPEYTAAFRFFLGVALFLKPPVLFAFGLYRRYWRYAGVRDLQVVILAVSAASTVAAFVVAVAVIAGIVPFFARSILAIDWLLALAGIAGIRFSIRLLGESPSAAIADGPAAPVRRVLVAGAGDAGALVVREMHKNPQLGMQPVGFVDDDPRKIGKRIYDVPVLGALADLESLVAQYEIPQVVIAMPKAEGATVRALLDACRGAGVEARAVPGVFELLDGGVSVSRLREVDIADLLRRRPIEVKPQAGLYLHGKTVLVTGAGGSIGSELSRQLARSHVGHLILLGHGENSIFDATNHLRATYPQLPMHAVVGDIRDRARLDAVFQQWRPHVVFHAAAHKHVPLMEDHPEEAITNNVVGTQVVVEASLAHGVERFVLISTDKAVAPTSVMGATKRLAERIVREAALVHRKPFVAVRFGNVLGSRGSVVPFFKQQIARGGPVTVTHPDMRRFFMTIPEAVYLVLKAGGLAQPGDLFVLNMGEPVRIVDLAEDLMRLSGIPPREIPIEFSGLRPGEKLEEELWEAGSTVAAVDDDSEVFRVAEPSTAREPQAIDDVISQLAQAAVSGDREEIHRMLGRFVPSFGAAPAAMR
jgi:FlaA1/EpsC-like NDP-sugar epimerase